MSHALCWCRNCKGTQTWSRWVCARHIDLWGRHSAASPWIAPANQDTDQSPSGPIANYRQDQGARREELPFAWFAESSCPSSELHSDPCDGQDTLSESSDALDSDDEAELRSTARIFARAECVWPPKPESSKESIAMGFMVMQALKKRSKTLSAGFRLSGLSRVVRCVEHLPSRRPGLSFLHIRGMLLKCCSHDDVPAREFRVCTVVDK